VRDDTVTKEMMLAIV